MFDAIMWAAILAAQAGLSVVPTVPPDRVAAVATVDVGGPPTAPTLATRVQSQDFAEGAVRALFAFGVFFVGVTCGLVIARKGRTPRGPNP